MPAQPCGERLDVLGLGVPQRRDGEVKMNYTSRTGSIDFTHVETLVYVYPSPHGRAIELEVEGPESFRVTPDGDHEITDLAGVGVVMQAGWLQITVYPNRECKPFVTAD
jgi:hypothetical protein